MSEEKPGIAGTQSLRRALKVMRLLALHRDEGLMVKDVTTLTGLERSTAHRLLTCLVEEQIAEQDPVSRRYRLGLGSLELGFAPEALIRKYRPVMMRLSRISGEAVFLVMRQGDYGTCVHIEPRKSSVPPVRVGQSFPLGTGCGPLAIYSQLPSREQEGIYCRHIEDFKSYGIDAATLERMTRRARENGFSEMFETIVPGVSGVGVPLSASSRPFASIVISGEDTRITPGRRAELGRMLQDTVTLALA